MFLTIYKKIHMAKYLITEQQRQLLDEVNLFRKLVDYGKGKIKKIKGELQNAGLLAK